jgi:hypothetical protein
VPSFKKEKVVQQQNSEESVLPTAPLAPPVPEPAQLPVDPTPASPAPTPAAAAQAPTPSSPAPSYLSRIRSKPDWYQPEGVQKGGYHTEYIVYCCSVISEIPVITISWVNDVVIVAHEETKIGNMIDTLKHAEYDLDSEREISVFLSIQIKRDEYNCSFTLTQEGLIQKVIDYCKMQDCNLTNMSANTAPFGLDKDGDRWVDQREEFEYAAAIGMLMYLANNTRPILPTLFINLLASLTLRVSLTRRQ